MTTTKKQSLVLCHFSVMSLAAIADIITGIFGQELVISRYCINSFVIITLGAFGIAEAGKIFGGKKQNDEE
jgi:hypothetical protein